MVEIKTSEEVKEALNDTATYLAKVPYASKNLLFVAASIKKYINGEESSLDHAFGLKLGRGQYPRGDGKGKYTKDDEEKHIKMIKKAIIDGFKVTSSCEVVRNKPMKTIAELNDYDEKEFKILFDRYKSQAIEMLASEITATDLIE